MNSPESTSRRSSNPNAFEELRKLLVGPERFRVESLEKQLEESGLSAEELAELLPTAIQIAEKKPQLAKNLGPTITDAFGSLIEREPQRLVEAISPIMGPAIRRSIIQTIQGMMQSFQTTIEQSFSLQGLKWRWESIRTGRSFAEVVMLNTLVYRVEQVFLIHRETGLLLAHVSNTLAGVIEADMISGMLTAIQDFVRDSFSGQRENLYTMDCEEHDVFIDYGSKAIVAAVVRGVAPPEVRTRLKECIEHIHVDFSRQLANFDGDNSGFCDAEGHLQVCLSHQVSGGQANQKKPNKIARWAWIVPAAALIGLMAWGGIAWQKHHRVQQLHQTLKLPETVQMVYHDGEVQLTGQAHHNWIVGATEKIAYIPFVKNLDTQQLENLDDAWLRFISIANEEPGVIVISHERIGDSYQISGLRDPLASTTESMAKQAQLARQRIDDQWILHQSLDPTICNRRAQQVLAPPKGVQLTTEDTTLALSGSASPEWIESALAKAAALPGFHDINVLQLRPIQPAWRSYVERLQQIPGIVVTHAEELNGRVRIVGMRDEAAQDPFGLLNEFNLDPDRIDATWKGFMSIDPAVVRKRIQSFLVPPSSVRLEVTERNVIITGSAPHQWLRLAHRNLPKLAPHLSIDIDECVDQDWEKIQTLRGNVESLTFKFNLNQAETSELQDQRIDRLATSVRQLQQLADNVEKRVSLTILGDARSSTQSDIDQLGKKRATAIKQELIKRHIPADIISIDSVQFRARSNVTLGKPQVTFRVQID